MFDFERGKADGYADQIAGFPQKPDPQESLSYKRGYILGYQEAQQEAESDAYLEALEAAKSR